MLDDLFEADNAAAARDLIARPLPPPLKPAKFSAWSAVPRGIAVAAGEVGASLSDLAGAAIAFRDTPSKQIERGGLPTAAFSSELGDSVRDYWRGFKPDPETASTAEQVLFGFSRGLAKLIPATLAAGPAGAIAAGVEEAMTVSDDLRRQGVPDGPRQIAGIIQGVGMGSAALPLLGRTLAETAALYVAGGPGGFMAQQALTRKVLEHAGQEKIAGNYDPFDPIGLTVASAIPLVFTAAGLRGQKLRAEAKAQADFIAGPRPSEPTPVAAAVAEAVRAPELSPEVVDAAMVNHLRVADEVGQAEIPARIAAVTAAPEPPHTGPEPWDMPQAVERALPEPAAIADDLRSLGRGAGWAQEGGSIIRDTPRDVGIGEGPIHMHGEVVGRTKWIPFEQWYAQMRSELGKGGLSKPQAIQDAIEKAIEGKPLKAAERRTVDWLRAEVQRMDDSLLTVLDDAPEVGRDARALGLGPADTADIAMTARAAELDAQAVERAAIRFEEDDAAFMAEVRRIVGDEEATRIEAAAADNARAGARSSGPEAHAAQGKEGDPLAKLNEPADVPLKAQAEPHMATVSARVAELDPELVVRMDPGGRHVTLAEDLAEVRRLAAEGTDDALGTLDADLLQVAVNCALSSGG